MQIIEAIILALRGAAVFNPEVQAAPACILWPDRDHQWEPAIPRLQAELPELMVLGEYDPQKRSGPAIWLRCILAGATDDVNLPDERPPIFYLPGVSRQDLRAVESCPDHLKPLAELQYRGVIWSQISAKDWTVLAFLKSDQGGLGLDVAQDNDAKTAMQLALQRLMEEDVELLKGKRLDKGYFNTLLTEDPTRDVLQWLDQGEAFWEERSENEWRAFVEVCKSHLAFSPEKEGILTGACKLAEREGPWHAVWERFCEAPNRYANIPTQIRKCSPPKDTMFWDMGGERYHGWPQWNADQEASLREALHTLRDLTPQAARTRVAELEKRHHERRLSVWAELGEAPLAWAVKYLVVLAEITAGSIAAGSPQEMAAAYSRSGWLADDALVRALACVENNEDQAAVGSAICAMYTSWAEDAARHLQHVVEEEGYPGGSISARKPESYNEGECVLFVDGLRFDVARRLVERLFAKGCLADERVYWAPLPTLTATGKPFVSPVRDQLSGHDAGTDFEPCVSETGKSLSGGYYLKKLLTDSGWEVLQGLSTGRPDTNAWCEFGNIDHEGHDKGWKLTGRLEILLKEIADRVSGLLSAGWQSVRIVTDHGWLLVPGGLPKIELPSVLTVHKWGRCAALKPGAATEVPMVPWYWDPNQYIALARGISCFREGVEYAHGGLSLQESLLLELEVKPQSTKHIKMVQITDVVWRGLRCTVGAEGEFDGLSLDIRKQAVDPSSSVALSTKSLKKNGTASVVVEDEEMEGSPATIVLLDQDGEPAAQIQTTVGESKDD